MSTTQFGLRPKTDDLREYRLGAVIRLPDLSTVPDTFALPLLKVKNQLNTDFCAMFAGCTLSEMQEGVELSPEWGFAQAKKREGRFDTWGLEIRDVMKSLQKDGSLPQQHAMHTVATKDRDFLADWRNWPEELNKLAIPHRKQSYFLVSGQYDHFDNARAAMWYFRDKLQGIEFGVNFGWPVDKVVLNTIPVSGYGHALVGFGSDRLENGELVIKARNSYNTEAGDGGNHYITRDVYNHFAEIYGHYMFVDISKEDAQYYIENGIKMEDNWVVQLLKCSLGILKSLFSFWR